MQKRGLNCAGSPEVDRPLTALSLSLYLSDLIGSETGQEAARRRGICSITVYYSAEVILTMRLSVIFISSFKVNKTH